MTDAQRFVEDGTVITGDELARMPDRGPCELVDGRTVPMSPTNPEHGRIAGNITAELHRVVRLQKLGLVMTGEVGIFTRWGPKNRSIRGVRLQPDPTQSA